MISFHTQTTADYIMMVISYALRKAMYIYSLTDFWVIPNSVQTDSFSCQRIVKIRLVVPKIFWSRPSSPNLLASSLLVVKTRFFFQSSTVYWPFFNIDILECFSHSAHHNLQAYHISERNYSAGGVELRKWDWQCLKHSSPTFCVRRNCITYRCTLTKVCIMGTKSK